MEERLLLVCVLPALCVFSPCGIKQAAGGCTSVLSRRKEIAARLSRRKEIAARLKFEAYVCKCCSSSSSSSSSSSNRSL